MQRMIFLLMKCLVCCLLLVSVLMPVTRGDECSCAAELTFCPPNSNTTGVGAASIDDCICDAGFADMDGVCVRVFDCPLNSGPVVGYAFSISDCVCDTGFDRRMTNTTCEPVDAAPSDTPVSLIAGVAVGGTAGLAGLAWVVVRFLSIGSTVPKPLPPSLVAANVAGGPAAVKIEMPV